MVGRPDGGLRRRFGFENFGVILGCHQLYQARDSLGDTLNTPSSSCSSGFGDGQDFEHSKSIVFQCSREYDFGLDSRQLGETFEPVLRCARDIVL